MSQDHNMPSRRDSLNGVPTEPNSGQGDACVFVEDLMSQLEAFSQLERVSLVKEESVSQLMLPCTQNVLERISEECGIEMPSKEAADALRASVGEISSVEEKVHAEQLAARKKELVGKTVTGRLKPSHMGRRKGFFIKWNEHDNDTVFINKDRVEQYLGPNPKNGLMVSCTIVDLGPSWAPVERQHPYTQAIVPLDTRWMNRSPNHSNRGFQQPSSKPESVEPLVIPGLVTSTPSVEASPSPKTAAKTAVQLNWQKIQAACKELIAKKQMATKSWNMVKTAIPTMLEDKNEMPRNRRSSAFACRQHRRSDMGGAARSWRRGLLGDDTGSKSSRGIRPAPRALPPRSNSMRGYRRGRAGRAERSASPREYHDQR